MVESNESSPEQRPSSLDLSVAREGDQYTVRLAGELDLAGVEEAEEALQKAEASDAATILLDIDDLRFIDSTGLKMLLEASRRDDEVGRLKVTRGSGHVAEMLRITGIDKALPFA